MSDEHVEKTPLDKLNGVVSQLKEMEHYARSNLETLSAVWLLVDEEFRKKKKLADRVNELLKAQSTMEELLKSVIEDFGKAGAELEKAG